MNNMNDLDSCEFKAAPIPVSFKVVGVGNGVADIVEKVKSFGYDCVGCIVAQSPDYCIPADDDKMVIIVAKDNYDIANAIAKTYHDAGLLTLGLLKEADYACYDSVDQNAPSGDYPDIIKILLQSIVSEGLICYDFNDLCTTLHNMHSFTTLMAEGADVKNAVAGIQEQMGKIAVENVKYMSAILYFNRERQPAITMEDINPLYDMLSGLPESVDVIWSVNYDDSLPVGTIRLTSIMSGQELRL